MNRRIPLLLCLPWLCLAVQGADDQATRKPVLLYSRHYNAKGETRYLPDGNYKLVLERLREHYTVRIHDLPLTPETLSDVKLILISNPSDKAVGNNPAPPHLSTSDIEVVNRFLERGGGLILMANQENHNLETDAVNTLLARYGLTFTNRFTDAKQLLIPARTPLLGGLRWAFYTGNQILVDSTHPAMPRSLVVNDLNQKPAKGTRDEPGVLLAVAEPGKGRVVAITDSGWITNEALTGKGIGGVSIPDQDNWEIFLRLSRWASGRQ